MRTRDRTLAAAFALIAGAAPGFALDGTVRPSADGVAPSPPPAISRAVQSDVPRPPGSIPNAGVRPAGAIPNATLPRPSAPVPRLSAPSEPAIDRPLLPPPAFAAPSLPITPFEALKSGTRALKDGQKDKAIRQLEYAADQGIVAAQWKLGRMYAEGDGVEQSDAKAFEYFSRIANGHPDDNPGGPQARYVANAFVFLGHYYREGIADADVRADPGRARHLYAYAASYFADPDAQYYLGRMLLDGPNGDPRQAARWLHAAANKGQTHAQAVLGRMLFKGESVPRQAARGLMWLTLARSNAVASDAWIAELHESAVRQATNDERALAHEYLTRWMTGRRD